MQIKNQETQRNCPPIALSIAGSDSSAGAGVQADLKTFQAHNVYGLTAITAVTVQNTQGVYGVQEITPEIVRDQIMCLFEDLDIDAVKIGMVFNLGIIRAVARSLEKLKPRVLVLDPVMISKSGFELLRPDAQKALQQELMPLADIVTPNLPEASKILGREISSLLEMEAAARDLIGLGPRRVVLKGGHLQGSQAVDVYFDGDKLEYLQTQYLQTKNTHGTGCTFASAIAANLAHGISWSEAVHKAKAYVYQAISNALPLGHGHGPTNHFFDFRPGTRDGVGHP